eukprot:snap_masked-scaffold405_size181423-processed-gene-0.9 protein:Tk08178 transcript:snap_masked-scaffold405_size181423-processed-gene-0.9-mRNA-1 annotation:"protein casp-like"
MKPTARFVDLQFACLCCWSLAVVASGVRSSCRPHCCPPGQTLDLNFECQPHQDPTEGVRDEEGCPIRTFYPRCTSGDPPERKSFPAPLPISSKRMSNSLGRFEMQIPGTGFTVQTFYNVDERALPRGGGSNLSLAVYPKPSANFTPIPASFCVDGKKALVCPRTRFDKAKILKCCPFGKKVQFPLANEAIQCAPLEFHLGEMWKILLNGYSFPLQDLIRFPYENVFHDFQEPLSCSINRQQRLVFDYSAFVVNRTGQLSFTRLLNGQGLSKGASSSTFCVDMATLEPEPRVSSTLEPIVEKNRPKLHLMMALFCLPKHPPNHLFVHEELLKILEFIESLMAPRPFLGLDVYDKAPQTSQGQRNKFESPFRRDGPSGSRNALEQVLFPSIVAKRSTRSEAVGVVSPHLSYAASTLVDNGIAMWNKFPALREASIKWMASNLFVSSKMASEQENRDLIVDNFLRGCSATAIAKKLKGTVCRATVFNVVKKFRETHSTSNKPQARIKWRRTPEVVKRTREKIRRNPERNITRMAKSEDMASSTMWKVFREDLDMFPYRKKRRLASKWKTDVKERNEEFILIVAKMASKLQSLTQFWQGFDLPAWQGELDEVATDITARQDESDLSRKGLIDLMREFKKSHNEETRLSVAPLIKSFQNEVDSLSKRSKAAEKAFFDVYKKLADVGDPVPVLEHACEAQKSLTKLADYEIETKQLRSTIQDYNQEIQEYKAKEKKLNELQAKVDAYDRNIDQTLEVRIAEVSERILEEYNEKLRLIEEDKGVSLQAENANLRIDKDRMATELEEARQQLTEVTEEAATKGKLASELEEHVARLQQISTLNRGEAEGRSSADILVGALDLEPGQEPPQSPGADGDYDSNAALLPIVQAQRERYRQRNEELEENFTKQSGQLSLLQNQIQDLQSDNVKLYEKIRYIQGYGGQRESSAATSTAVSVESRYKSQYDQKMDPFSTFSQQEKQKRYSQLNVFEKIILSFVQIVLANKTARLFMFAYALLLHVLVFAVLMKLAYTDAYRRDLAAEWHEKYMNHMEDSGVMGELGFKHPSAISRNGGTSLLLEAKLPLSSRRHLESVEEDDCEAKISFCLTLCRYTQETLMSELNGEIGQSVCQTC